ncbi:hypothetical protein CXB51_014453 [Gossypium anomalum]|uniref:Uncharacterized protein n=1 Tax=Gossypium anomalum TaxID=47600 RepID=A0A8J5YK13_9ROSI|nr:hypothetical protein CXB51_014453 [Gossypium anomalum]
MASSGLPIHIHCSAQKPSVSSSANFDHLKSTLSSAFKPFLKQIERLPLRIDVAPQTLNNTCLKLVDAAVDSVFEFADQPLLPSQSNFGPVDEMKEAVQVTNIQGEIPRDFAEGVYIRNGPNPIFGALTSTSSMFGRSSYTWIEGEGMLHALYFCKGVEGDWTVLYKNRYVETETLKLEKQRNKPSFLPALEGDSPAILSAYLLNMLRYGKVNKEISNTNVFEHGGKMYSIAENHKPQEINILTLETLNDWDVNGGWKRPFSSHPKKAPGTGELVILGIDATKPFAELGVISADGNTLLHRADLKLNRCSLCHEIGVTQRLMKYEKEGYARIGIMPRYGSADSIQWFKVVMWGCRALDSIIPGPDKGQNKFDWFSRKLRPIKPIEGSMDAVSEDQLVFPRPYEWRMNKQTGGVKERNLTGTEYSMDFPFINEGFKENEVEGLIKVEYHMFEKNTFGTGAAFVPKQGGVEEDDGWVVTKPVARITLPFRVPYGFHGTFRPMQLQNDILSIIPSLNSKIVKSISPSYSQIHE